MSKDAPPVIRQLESFEDARPLAAAWDALVARAGGHIFMTYDWLRCWWEHFGAEDSLRLLVLESAEGDLLGFAPWYVTRRRHVGMHLRTLCLVGDHDAGGDFLGMILQPGQERLARLCMEHLWQQGDWDLLEYGNAAAGDLPLTHLRHWLFANDVPFHLHHCHICPVLTVRPATVETFRAMPDVVYKKIILKDRDRFAKKHGMRMHRADAESLPADLARFFELHAARWDALGQTSSFAEPRRRSFFEHTAATCMALGRLRLFGMLVDGQMEAMEFGLAFAGKQYFLQSGRSEAGSKVKAGNMLQMEIIEASLGEIEEFHFLWGDEPYKYQTGAVPRMTITLQAARTARGRLALAAAQCRTAAKALARCLLSR
ncbi:GNAT family N-acetyltransferase [Megalodesulfovibrio gigas]|uniref:BioF2-like acetyltransferase domain-containing protein n=1 Tax=Megalodesulfovibrio gigas (strain ATCC 19364 / DSM 1382 / NCIMB 9332 / VKM B-1759) TaxID=1121448 RepID=T2GC94_MEGG1|nr:GNAT family N-acetyltransferase [Megalodesulfovibrio gigas]AGW13741.1 hypothetical protein DGI_1964 [Megalodesulfovibrio gigas DSM 1382 = ATCC 19364]